MRPAANIGSKSLRSASRRSVDSYGNGNKTFQTLTGTSLNSRFETGTKAHSSCPRRNGPDRKRLRGFDQSENWWWRRGFEFEFGGSVEATVRRAARFQRSATLARNGSSKGRSKGAAEFARGHQRSFLHPPAPRRRAACRPYQVGKRRRLCDRRRAWVIAAAPASRPSQ